MKTLKLFSALMIVALMLAVTAPGIALAGAYEATWASTIAYQNIGSASATVYIAFYENASDTSPDSYPAGTIAKDASKVIIVGDLVTGTFRGSAVLSADQPMAAIIVQNAGGAVAVRPVSSGFTSGNTSTIITTAYKTTNAITQFSVQNVGPGDATARIKFVNTDGVTIEHQYDQLIKPGAGHFVDTNLILDADLPDGWTGTVQIDRFSGTGMLISSAMETNTSAAASPNKAFAFEGVAGGAIKNYMPSAFCKNGAQNTQSYYAIANPNAGTATITVNFTWSDATTTSRSITIAGYGKKTVWGCDHDGPTEPTGKTGAGVVNSDIPVIVMGKIQNPSYSSGFMGISVGYAKLALPFVRYANTTYFNAGNYQRTFVTIQNISGFALAAGNVTVKYIDRNGTVVATHSLDAMVNEQKRTSYPTASGEITEFGYYDSYTTSGGGAIIECSVANCKLAVVVRAETRIVALGTNAGEDYNGIPYAP